MWISLHCGDGTIWTFFAPTRLDRVMSCTKYSDVLRKLNGEGQQKEEKKEEEEQKGEGNEERC